MSAAPKGTIFFDFAESVGIACWSFDGSSLHSFTPHRGIISTLERLRVRPAKMGVITIGSLWSEPLVRQQLERSGLMPFLDPALIMHWAQETETQFQYAATRAGFSVDLCEFVSPYAARLKVARAAGFQVVNALELAGGSFDADTVTHFRAVGTRRQIEELAATHPDVLVFEWYRVPDGVEIVAKARRSSVAAIRQLIATDELPVPDWIESAEVFLTSSGNDAQESLRFLPRDSAWTLAKKERRTLLAAPEVRPQDDLDPHLGCSGHLVRVRPRSLGDLLNRPLPATAIPTRALLPAEKAALSKLDGERLHADLVPWWSRLGDPDASDAIESRDIHHPHNSRAVDKAARLLATICPSGLVHRCTFAGPVNNPLFNVHGEITGLEQPEQVVVVAAHLDSISASASARDQQESPGLDDDASGMAGVLAVARTLVELKALSPDTAPRRTIRFVFFNAEEDGLVGSQAYVAAHPTTAFVAVFQLDMIGFARSYPARTVEIHSGSVDALHGTGSASRELARILEGAIAEVSPCIDRVQIYPYPGCTIDRGGRDSDDTAFRAHGIPACKVCEDFYTDDCAGVRIPHHPTYHSIRDVSVDPNYAAAIARGVAAATWKIANA